MNRATLGVFEPLLRWRLSISDPLQQLDKENGRKLLPAPSTMNAKEAKAEEDGKKFLHMVFWYTGIIIVLLVTVALLIRLWLRPRSKFKSQYGMFSSASWPWVFHGPWSLFIMLFSFLPVGVFTISGIFGCILAEIEDWYIYVGMGYVISNVLGLQNPLVNVSTKTVVGNMSNLAISVWAMLFTTTCMGVASRMSLIVWVTESMPRSASGFFRYLFIYIPFGLLVSCVIAGGVMSKMEAWSFKDGFFFMAGAITGLANPLVNVTPATPQGMFFECLCICIELCIGGAVIGIVSAHPVVMNFIIWFEGQSSVATHEDSAPKQSSMPSMKGSELEVMRDRVRSLEDQLLRFALEEEVTDFSEAPSTAFPTPTVVSPDKVVKCNERFYYCCG